MSTPATAATLPIEVAPFPPAHAALLDAANSAATTSDGGDIQ